MSINLARDEYHRRARNFANSLSDNERGQWVVAVVFMFDKGEALPDYEQVIGLFRSRESAEKAAYYERIARHQCIVVVQA